MQDKRSDPSSKPAEIADNDLDKVAGGMHIASSSLPAGPSIKSSGPGGSANPAGGNGDLGGTTVSKPTVTTGPTLFPGA